MSTFVDEDNKLYPNPVGADEDALVLSSDIAPSGIGYGLFSGPIRQVDTTKLVGAGPIGLAALFAAPFNSPAEIVVVDTDNLALTLCPVDTATMPLLTNIVTTSIVQPQRVVAHASALIETPLADGLFGYARPGRALEIVILND